MFGFMTLLMSGIDMYAMALVMKVVLGWDISFSIWVSSATVGAYVALGGLRSAIFNEVLQFALIWFGALLISGARPHRGGRLDRAEGKDRAQPRPQRLHAPVDASIRFVLGQSDGHPLVRHRLRPGLRDLVRILDHGLLVVVQRVLAAKDIRAAKMAPVIGSGVQDAGAVHRDRCPACWAWPSSRVPMGSC